MVAVYSAGLPRPSIDPSGLRTKNASGSRVTANTLPSSAGVVEALSQSPGIWWG